MYKEHSKNNVFPWKLQQKQEAQQHHEKAISQLQNTMFHIVTITGYVFSPAINKCYSFYGLTSV